MTFILHLPKTQIAVAISQVLNSQCMAAAVAKSLQWCLILCDPMDGSPPDPSVPGILQARILE